MTYMFENEAGRNASAVQVSTRTNNMWRAVGRTIANVNTLCVDQELCVLDVFPGVVRVCDGVPRSKPQPPNLLR